MNKNEREYSGGQETPDKTDERRDSSDRENDLPFDHETSGKREDAGRADSTELTKIKSRLKNFAAEDGSRPVEDKTRIIRRFKERVIKPEKPTLRDSWDWMVHTSIGQRYDSDAGTKIYDKFARYHFGGEAEANDIALALLENIQTHPNDALICERAAGTGIVTEALAEAGFRIRASDLSRSQLDLLSSRLPGVETVQENINGPMEGVADATADGVLEVAADRFMTSDGQLSYVQEAYRILKPGGILIWPTSPFEAVTKLKHGLAWKSGKRQIERLLTENGFEIISDKLRIYRWNLSAITHMIIAKKKTKE